MSGSRSNSFAYDEKDGLKGFYLIELYSKIFVILTQCDLLKASSFYRIHLNEIIKI